MGKVQRTNIPRQIALQRNKAGSFVLDLYYSAFDSQPWRDQCVILNRGYPGAVSREEIGTERFEKLDIDTLLEEQDDIFFNPSSSS
mmetsp:Transcript_17144/g.19330  ORF Transcript_17144/g.19330 Transcript_17144/m.19330 type:complete len:86 (+) Transcript_17144:139-396(+)